MAHERREGVVIYRNRDRRVGVGVIKRDEAHIYNTNMHIYKLNINIFCCGSQWVYEVSIAPI